jgi:preprotein translocase subunit SecG
MDILHKFLTVILFLNCLFMILLVLVQLPKKEAGLGTAFGGGATDALFGAGAGNVLTKLTKWCAVLFLVLCLALSLPFMNPKGLQEGEGSSSKAGGAKQPSQNGPGQTPGTIPASTTNDPPVKPAPKKPGEEKDKVPGPDKK